MVDVPKKRHHRRPRHLQGRIFVCRIEAGQQFLLKIFGRLDVELHSQFGGEQVDRVSVEHRSHARHRASAEREQFLQHFTRRQTNRLREGTNVAGHLNCGVCLAGCGSRHGRSTPRTRPPPPAALPVLVIATRLRNPPSRKLPLLATTQDVLRLAGIWLGGDSATRPPTRLQGRGGCRASATRHTAPQP